MDYFILKQDGRFSRAPVVKDWFGRVNKRDICPERADLLPSPLTLPLEPKEDMQYTDVLTYPFLIVSKRMRDLIKLYQPFTRFHNVLLADLENAQGEMYVLPILRKESCLAEGSGLNLDGSVIRKVVIDVEKTRGSSIFQLGGTAGTYTVVRLDFAESMMREGMEGFTLVPVERVCDTRRDLI